MRKVSRKIVGIDEAGRGPLAGPVVVGGVVYKGRGVAADVLAGIKDSKQLSARQREEWFRCITMHPDFRYAVARIYPATIDRINILRAARLGARRVYEKLAPDRTAHAMLDGSLRLPMGISQETIIRGDETVPLISAAAIIAKVTRDRLMLRLHKQYPAYRFDLHKGYGTALHREMIAEFGRCEIHRKSFQFHR